ncbi:MAG: enoyl-CoA hydratase/isomerase family protein [Hyphomonas sp.]|uniref:enoyl-CoA hydratase-related protein n=1 Tax=Hyphomonas sp. TaxID=87 RepID=UPI0017A47401|nr:enoyl-CoA hydratase-related protein [Hyphomonas sp.]MBU3919238.1 enoyl-CoA hydratase/isomerase family protein [Alphaproteobacteria bacterium]MBA3068779.1 enoyl-CoA hydratase/isomerase family protein [Hyphomonas sp.]MBU4062712.1 enoyl-CoA hydratase/isomerase family protein [Alphaproteobacteria bacterium]MBU4166220.1 enoyl-CoA hydratase/isomerase family protein [Alphaproteobacteria bacterium]MBU4568173.1 enoyl-CoA hydratase/isomerase family protein [Alphaproteobacteria bacterium]
MRDADYDLIKLDVTRAGVAIVTLHRPDVHNAFNAELIAELTDVFAMISDQPGIRMMILRGEGKSFSAGADLEWMKLASTHSRDDNETDAMRLAEMLQRLYEMPQMTLALVQGAAMGGGAGLVAACDVAIAMASAQFRFSEVRLGLTPATISPFVIQAIGPRWARALFVTGEEFDAAYAEKIGLIQYVAQTADEMTDLEEHIARLVFAAAPGAVADSKKLVRDFAGKPIDRDVSQRTAKRIAARRTSDEGKEGVSAFLEKRPPSWKT